MTREELIERIKNASAAKAAQEAEEQERAKAFMEAFKAKIEKIRAEQKGQQ